MAYSDFTLERVERELQLRLDMETLFADAASVEPPEYLTQWLRRGEVMPLTSEKARNERIIAPILMTVAELSGVDWTIFSGHPMSVDPQRGLSGECDFLVANTEPVPVLRALCSWS